MTKLSLDLHKLAKFTNLAIPAIFLIFLAGGTYFSFYLHFGTVTFLFLTIINFFYRHVQNEHTVLRNFGILGQARYVMESVGPELRQYFFANDTEERPFNREERSEVYRKSKNIDSASSFGSLANFDDNEIKIRHSMFPTPKESLEEYRCTFGEERGIAQTHTFTRPIAISAMSYGALGQNAVRALARGAKRAKITMNTGEGGHPKYHLQEAPDLIFQLGTAKFGVRNDDGTLNDEKLRNLAAEDAIKMIEIKLSQGAKPGKGGLLPKEKITKEISALRGVPRDQDVISPASHAECVDAASTVAFIRHVQEVSELPTGIKLCLGCPREFAALVTEMKKQDTFPDYIAVDGGEGGTGAAPKAFLDHYGMPLLPALHTIQNILTEEGVRDRLKIIAAGKLIGPGRQMIALSLGADAIYSARGFMLALGCIQALQCGNNTCPVGITTHDPKLQKGLDIAAKAIRVANYAAAIEHDFYQLLAATGKARCKDLSVENLYIPRSTTLSAPLVS
ncbi:FMN-binding glutamate synthase family protein [Verrucomicrobiaceae bacterium 227]